MPSVPPPELRYLSLAQAGAIANLSIRTLRRAIAAGKLRAHRVGRLTRIGAAELRRWVEADGAAAPRNRRSVMFLVRASMPVALIRRPASRRRSRTRWFPVT